MNLERPDRDEVEVLAERITVVTALPLKRAARERLSELLNARVVDIREVVDRADLVIAPSCSPQTIGALQRTYPGARIVVAELDDWEFDINLSGPVKRVLRGGADAYLLADSIDELARRLTSRSEPVDDEGTPPDVRELPVGESVDDVIAAFLRESAEYAQRVRVQDPPHS